MKAVAWLIALAFLGAAAPAAPPAADMLRAGASAGDPDSQFQLGQAYQLGKGVPQDAEMAMMWYRRAASQGHAQASDELGFVMFSHGQRRAAMPYIERAAARGDPRAFYLLGTAHFNGDLASRDWPLAYAQTARAAEAGLPAAKANLQMMEQYLLPPDRAKADGILATLPPVRRALGAPPAPTPAPPPPVTAPAVAATPAPVAPPPAPRRAAGAWRVQLGAYSSADNARTAWDGLVKKVRGLSAFERSTMAAGSVLRLQAVGLADRAEAEALCGKVRAAGGACLVLAP
jgi:TPR repeat protein